MLSRTADSLFWLARYVERAGSIARIVQAGHRMSSLALSMGNPGNEWHSALIASGQEPAFLERYQEVIPANVIDFLVRDPDNPSSIVSSIETARRNARAVRTALTVDMWEALNETWQTTRSLKPADIRNDRIDGFLEWVVQRSMLFSGAYESTMLRNDAYRFTRLGSVLERADTTARILDVKYHVLLPSHEGVGGALDHFHWQSILRSVSALRAYHWIYKDRLKPWLVAELLILRPELPRSMLSSCAGVADALESLAAGYGGRRGECHRLAGEMHAKLRYSRIEDIFRSGLHEFLTQFIDSIVVLGRETSAFYLSPSPGA